MGSGSLNSAKFDDSGVYHEDVKKTYEEEAQEASEKNFSDDKKNPPIVEAIKMEEEVSVDKSAVVNETVRSEEKPTENTVKATNVKKVEPPKEIKMKSKIGRGSLPPNVVLKPISGNDFMKKGNSKKGVIAINNKNKENNKNHNNIEKVVEKPKTNDLKSSDSVNKPQAKAQLYIDAVKESENKLKHYKASEKEKRRSSSKDENFVGKIPTFKNKINYKKGEKITIEAKSKEKKTHDIYSSGKIPTYKELNFTRENKGLNFNYSGNMYGNKQKFSSEKYNELNTKHNMMNKNKDSSNKKNNKRLLYNL